jgi:uncharacterized damage-inducible protein DinB
MTQASAPPIRSAISDEPFALLFPDLEGELNTTRRILERVPNGQDDWRPHEKSMTLGQLATHIAQLPGFGISMLTRDEFDVSTRGPQPKPTNTAERIEMFEEVSAQLRGLLQQLTWDQALSVWKLKFRDRVFLEGPRVHMVRSACITHLAHHRAQLGVYLRILGVPIPGSYGPSADEPIPPT